MQTITAGKELTAAVLNDWTPGAGTGTCTAATNFSVSLFTVYKIAGVTWFSVNVSYSGSTLTGDSTSNITDTECVTLPFAPQAPMYVTYQGASGAAGNMWIKVSGQCWLTTLNATATISSGDTITFAGVILTG